MVFLEKYPRYKITKIALTTSEMLKITLWHQKIMSKMLTDLRDFVWLLVETGLNRLKTFEMQLSPSAI